MMIFSAPSRRAALAGLLASSALFPVQSAQADNMFSKPEANQTVTIAQASQLLGYAGGNDQMRISIAPRYSEELGLSVRGAAGRYLSDEIALGLIVEYGENKREYLANVGIQLSNELSLVSTAGFLEEHNEYVEGEDREKVQQYEYGASLKGAYEFGFVSGLELNGYLADAQADSESVEAGKLYGVQLLTNMDLTQTTRAKLGGGYEWLEWDDTNDEDDNSFTFSAEVVQQLDDTLSLTGHAKRGASEFVYGGGLAFDLGNGGLDTNVVGISYSHIDGRNGIEDDTRVELTWSIGFGAVSATSTNTANLANNAGTISAAADVAMASPANGLLSDVMKRQAFMPERVVARAGGAAGSACPITVVNSAQTTARDVYYNVYGLAALYYTVDAAVPEDHVTPIRNAILLDGDTTTAGGDSSAAFYNYYTARSTNPASLTLNYEADGTVYACSISLEQLTALDP